MQICMFATCLSKSVALSDWLISDIKCIFGSARLCRWYPRHRRHTVRQRYRCTLTALFRAVALALVGFQGLAFLRGGITASASLAAIAPWHLRVSKAPSAVTDPSLCLDGICSSNSGSMGASPILFVVTFHSPNVQCFLVDPDGYLAPYPAFRTAMLAGVPLAFTLGFDAGVIDQTVQRARAALIWQAHVHCLLAATRGAET